ncbi:MAG: hypothetical protein U0528_09015 [Anaerolineae bacterium]
MKSFKVLGLALALALAASALGGNPVAKAQDKVIKISSQRRLCRAVCRPYSARRSATARASVSK